MKLDTTKMPTPPPPDSPKQINMKLTMDMALEIQKTEPGKYTMLVSVNDAKAEGNMPGMNLDQVKGKSGTIICDEYGKILQTSGELSQMLQQSGNNVSLEFPRRKLKIGDTFEATMKNQAGDITMVYKLDSVEKVNGEDAIKLLVTIKDNASLKTNGPMYTWVGLNSGRVVKARASMLMPQVGGTMSMALDKTD
jgi:hypothetical protein